MHSVQVFHDYERTRWTLKDIPWQDIKQEEVSAEYLMLARSAVMGECNSIAAVHGFLNEFTDDYDFSAFVSIWGYEELQHHYAFRTWLTKCGETVNEEPVKATRQPYPPGITPASTLATNVISELTVCYAYHHTAAQIKEPVLGSILQHASRDEARHAKAFTFYAQRRLGKYPAELESVLETLYVYAADEQHPLKHPVSVFKGDLPELQNQETIDDGLAYFAQLSNEYLEKLRRQIFTAFSRVTGLNLLTPLDVRRELKRVILSESKA
jgi:hypothetical protein